MSSIDPSKSTMADKTTFNAANDTAKQVGDPNAAYESLAALWLKSRAACSGERFIKAYDEFVDVISFTNILVPFSSSMTQKQYEFYKAEAEWPGITAFYLKTMIGGLLRKQPQLTLPDNISSEVSSWILNSFGHDDSPLTAFLYEALLEEFSTSRAWVVVDYPSISENEYESLDDEARSKLKPYPVLYSAEDVVNWQYDLDDQGKTQLIRVIIKTLEEDYSKNEFHPDYVPIAWVHELVDGFYRIRKFKQVNKDSNVPVTSGRKVKTQETSMRYELEDSVDVLINGERLDFIPAWPLNGSAEPSEPMLMPIIDKEISLYNKMSRRNHLLYGAATYTPVVSSDMSDEEFAEIVGQGLGSWIHLRAGESANVLDTPTDALSDMDRAIAANIEEIAKLGVRMLTPETSQSGVALEIRNASQISQLGTLNIRVSNTLRKVIAFMIKWRYNIDIDVSDITFSMSTDFNPTPLGADWLRIATEWYEAGLIPRSVWLIILKHNDMIPPDYDDEEGLLEINSDELTSERPAGDNDFVSNIERQIEDI